MLLPFNAYRLVSEFALKWNLKETGTRDSNYLKMVGMVEQPVISFKFFSVILLFYSIFLFRYCPTRFFLCPLWNV